MLAHLLTLVVGLSPALDDPSTPRAAQLLVDSDGIPLPDLSEREMAGLLLPKLLAKRERLRDEARPSLWLSPVLMVLSGLSAGVGGFLIGQAAMAYGTLGGGTIVGIVLAFVVHVALGIGGSLVLTAKIRERAESDARPTAVDPLIAELREAWPNVDATNARERR